MQKLTAGALKALFSGSPSPRSARAGALQGVIPAVQRRATPSPGRGKSAQGKGTFSPKQGGRVPLPCFQGFSAVRRSDRGRSAKGHKKDLAFNHTGAKKSSGSVTGLTAFGGAALFVAPVEICPVDRLRLFPYVPLVFEMDDVEDVLPLLLGQEPEHGY